MADVFTKEKRSEVMSRIRGKGNKDTEITLAKILRENGITGWRRHYKIIGCPDFAFPKLKLAIFVDGCFWHSCPKHGNIPQGNRDFWADKLAKNKTRDRLINKTLKSKGWIVMRIWDHDLHKRVRHATVKRLLKHFG